MCDFKGSTPECKCRMAVLNAYHGLLDEHQMPQSFALEAACLVYKHHHPEDKADVARLKVESWIHAGHLH